jgi:Xaa-Pro aminopeptidase
MQDPPRIQPTEFAERRARANRAARERDLDALLIWSDGSVDAFHEVYYFTNQISAFPWVPPCPPLVTGCEHTGLIISDDGTSTLLASNYVRDEVFVDEVRTNWNLLDELVACIEDLGLHEARVGVISETFPYSFGRTLERRYPRLVLEQADEISSELRIILSDSEAEMIRHAAQVGVHILESALEQAVPGATEGDFVGAGSAAAARFPGCLHWRFMAASGPFAERFVFDAVPCWNPTYGYELGDPAHADLFGFVNGYPYDLARSWTIGREPSEEQQRVSDGAKALSWTLARSLKPGITVRELHQVGMDVLSEHGLRTPIAFGTEDQSDPASAPGFGHALGCGFIPPYLVPRPPWGDRTLSPPAAFAFETFVTDGRGNYAAHEDMFLWLEGEVECLTSG